MATRPGGLDGGLGSSISNTQEGQSQMGGSGILTVGLGAILGAGILWLLADPFLSGRGEDSKPDSDDETHRATSDTPCGQKQLQSPTPNNPPAIGPAPKKGRTSYSSVTASDVVQRFTKVELIKEFKKLKILTDHRTVLLEARDLIDSNCRGIIQAKLKSGEYAGAATELVEYFEANHDGDKMMEFCTFLEDEAGEAAPLLKKLAKKIRKIVKTLSDTA